MEGIEINDDFRRAIEIIEGGKSVFVTGKAGTGKSTLLKYFCKKTDKNVVVLAPTGVAAINAGGQTIHSFFGFKPQVTVGSVREGYRKVRKAELYKNLEMIVIDEVSMVRADLIDCMDAFLRMHGPKRGAVFGGVQMVFFGDLYQLPPVVRGEEKEAVSGVYDTPYFFSAKAFSGFEFRLVELEKIYRQKDGRFVEILNGVRNKSLSAEKLSELNKRVDERFVPNGEEVYVYLTTTNDKAGMINNGRLAELKGKAWVSEGRMSGEFDSKALPVPLRLEVKVGAQVMLVNNDGAGRWVNGSMGTVVKTRRVDEEDDVMVVRLAQGEEVEVRPNSWEMIRYEYDRASKRLDTETVGVYTQYPVILAWAITIHKSQGKTFEKVILDMDRGAFAPGQTYVALSRCVSLSGLVLLRAIEMKHILTDWRVSRFLTDFAYGRAREKMGLTELVDRVGEAVRGRRRIEIVYLKANNDKSRRLIEPREVAEMEYKGRKFLGVAAYDELRGEERVFRLDRILEVGEKVEV